MAELPEGPQCDCGYVCEGETVEDRVLDGQRHAREVHGIDVSAQQVLERGQLT
jgi:hypothetical protein